MNFKGLKMALGNLGVMTTQINNYKMRFLGDGFAGECELLGNKREYTKLVRMSVNSRYDHEQVVQAQKLIEEWQRGSEVNGQCVICGAVVCDCINHSNDNEICWWLGTVAGSASNYLSVHCWENAEGVVTREKSYLSRQNL